MKEEIFGPILPILEYSTNQEAVEIVHSVCKNPLALYLFTSNKKTANDFSRSILSGGMCVNDCLMHINNNELPFGGVGESGIGKYHGRHSFETFSHQRGEIGRAHV